MSRHSLEFGDLKGGGIVAVLFVMGIALYFLISKPFGVLVIVIAIFAAIVAFLDEHNLHF